jgi:hypothetical protein
MQCHIDGADAAFAFKHGAASAAFSPSPFSVEHWDDSPLLQ